MGPKDEIARYRRVFEAKEEAAMPVLV
jgi:hypothetical protein